jgi:hypothetical protein
VRRFVRRLARQQGLSWLDPRMAIDRLYAGTGRVQRAFDFLEFVEAQEPAILEAESALFGFRNKMQNAKRTLIRLGVAILGVGVVLYLVLKFPDETRRAMPVEGSYEVVNIGLLVLLLVLIVVGINYVRGLGRED